MNAGGGKDGKKASITDLFPVYFKRIKKKGHFRDSNSVKGIALHLTCPLRQFDLKVGGLLITGFLSQFSNLFCILGDK